ncbi:hypothetical protein SBV1_1220017 [Verrucomicrobia bacterium]|nr:hypothetical protein SBV1_1220017 [Verrucomicrobiota bacterium]
MPIAGDMDGPHHARLGHCTLKEKHIIFVVFDQEDWVVVDHLLAFLLASRSERPAVTILRSLERHPWTSALGGGRAAHVF